MMCINDNKPPQQWESSEMFNNEMKRFVSWSDFFFWAEMMLQRIDAALLSLFFVNISQCVGG